MLTAWSRASPLVALTACIFAHPASKFLQAYLLRLCKPATSSHPSDPLVFRLTLRLRAVVARAEPDASL
jgi:hypothetical protein